MENKDYKIVITSLVPRPVSIDGKSGADVRTAEILRKISCHDYIEKYSWGKVAKDEFEIIKEA